MREGAPFLTVPAPAELTRVCRATAKRIEFCAGIRRKIRVPQLLGGGTKHQLSMSPRNLSSCSCRTLCTMGSPRPERRRKPEGRGLACAGDGGNAPAPLFPLSLSHLLCCWSRGMGSPCLFFTSRLFLSLRLLFHCSPRPAAIFLFLGTPAHPAVMSVLISPHMAMPRPSCAHALDSSLCLLVF